MDRWPNNTARWRKTRTMKLRTTPHALLGLPTLDKVAQLGRPRPPCAPGASWPRSGHMHAWGWAKTLQLTRA